MRIFRFEQIDDTLPLLPLAARRALDVAGKKLSLAGWRALDLEARRTITEQGGRDRIDVGEVTSVLSSAQPQAEDIPADDESRLDAPVEDSACEALWPRLDRLERFALAHLHERGDEERLASALAEIGGHQRDLTHLDDRGQAHMVDVREKSPTHRRAVARAVVRMRPETAVMVRDHSGPKGDVLAVARVAGIMAAKRTPDLVPLCHTIALTKVTVRFEIQDEGRVLVISAAEAFDRTGVEMEAMVAASVAALTIYDMLKAVQRDIVVEEVALLEKLGGRSGHYLREERSS